MTGPNICSSGGWLTGGTYEFPSEPSHFFWPLRTPSLGCTNLACRQCGVSVRSQLGLRLRQGAGEHAGELFETADWADSPWLEADTSDSPFRVYVCRCGVWQASYPRPVAEADEFVDVPWTCAGHPLATLPLNLDGIEVREDKLRGLVERNYKGWVPDGAPEFERDLFRFWTLRLYGRVYGSEAAGIVAHTAMAHLLDGAVAARFAALHFTWTHPDNEGADALSRLDPVDIALFAGQSVPEGTGSMDLGEWLKKAMLKRNAHADLPERDRLRPLLQELAKHRAS